MKNKTETDKTCSIQSSACYAEEDMRRYLEDKMSDNDIVSFESHCDTCDHCAAALWRQKQSDFNGVISDADKELCKLIERKIKERLNQKDMPKEFGMKGPW